MKKINWKNVMKLIIMLVASLVIVHDIYKLTIYSSITGRLAGFTWFGFITFILCIGLVIVIYDEIKSVSKIGTLQHTTQNVNK